MKKSLVLLLISGYCSCLFAQEAILPTQWTKAALAAAVSFPDYPRPQLQRPDWMCLNGKWDYLGGKDAAGAFDPEKPAAFDKKKESILVPYCPESVLSGIRRSQEINMWYRRSFTIPSGWKGRRVITTDAAGNTSDSGIYSFSI